MKRREFIGLIGGAAVAWPLTARAQQSPRRIGVLLVGLSPQSKSAQSFLKGLTDAGYSVGRDVMIEWRLAHGDYDRVPELVADLVRNKVDVMVMDSTIGTEVAMRSTSTIPIVMALGRRSGWIKIGQELGASWRERHRALNDDIRPQLQTASIA